MVQELLGQELSEVVKLCEKWGRQAATDLEGSAEAGADRQNFSQMEEASVQLSQAFQRGFLGAKLEQDARRYGDEQCCPECQKACARHEEKRSLHVRHGCLELSEPAFYCPRCRRDFFPSASGVAAHEL